MNTDHDYYSVLGIKRSASQDEIKRAYRKAVFRYHPDRNPDDHDASEKFKRVLDAYEVLSDSGRRANYDQVARPAESETEPEGCIDPAIVGGISGAKTTKTTRRSRLPKER